MGICSGKTTASIENGRAVLNCEQANRDITMAGGIIRYNIGIQTPGTPEKDPLMMSMAELDQRHEAKLPLLKSKER